MRLRISLLVAVLLIGAAAIAYGQLSALGRLHKIVVSSVMWDDPGWLIEINDGDRYVYRHGAVETTGRIAFAPFAQRLAAVIEVRYLASSPDAGTGLTFWVEGRRRTVQRFVAVDSAGHAALRSFAAALHDAVAADTRRQDAPRIEALTSLHDLIAVEVVSNVCLGWCGGYDEVLRRDRDGELIWQERFGTTHRRAPAVAWQRVVGVLRAAHVERLERKYPIRAVDTASATFRFVFPRATYTVEAPDSTAWPHELVLAFDGMRHLAHDMAWSPALAADQLRTLGR